MTRAISRRKALLGFSALGAALASKAVRAQSLPVRRVEPDYKEDLFYREDWLGEPWRNPDPVVLNHGTDHVLPGDTSADSPLYARLGYSTATVPPLTAAAAADPVDNAVVLLDEDGRASHRTGFETLFARKLPGGVLSADSRGPVRWVDSGADDSPDHGSGRTGPTTPGPVVTVASVQRAGVEVRLVRVDAPAPVPPGDRVRMGGWPVAAGTPPETWAGTGRAAGAGPYAEAGTASLRSSLRGLRGLHRGGVATGKGDSPLGARTATPWLATDGVPNGDVLAAVVALDGGGQSDQDGPDPAVSVHPGPDGGHRARLTWPDGLTTDVELPAVPPVAPLAP